MCFGPVRLEKFRESKFLGAPSAIVTETGASRYVDSVDGVEQETRFGQSQIPEMERH